ncbi:MAG: SMP-30/gluconolactonase/LRE family protein [Bauldia sp.]|nr:SMP-30/gluconolactonase/LRE family protein [Bauldia sp.]
MTNARNLITRRTALLSIGAGTAGALAAPYVARAQSTLPTATYTMGTDEAFATALNGGNDTARLRGPIQRIAIGFNFTEGPVWFGDQQMLIFSDLGANRLYRWDNKNERLDIYRDPSNHVNGNTTDKQGRLISCEQQTRRVTRTEHSGDITVIADSFEGKQLNTPNDVVVHSNGSIWFTDPPNGLDDDFEGRRTTREQENTNVFRVDPDTGEITAVITDIQPNGLCFSEDESKLYVTNSRTPAELGRIRVYDVSADTKTLENPRIFINPEMGSADGIKCDFEGNIWASWGGSPELAGVRVFAPDGTDLLQITLPTRAANLCFGGPVGNMLFMTSNRMVYRVFTNTRGANMI